MIRIKDKKSLFLILLYAAVLIAVHRVWTVHKVMASLQDAPFSQFEGPADAPKTMVEFFDYRCSFCRDLYPVIEQVLAKHPDVKVIYRHYPAFGRPSLTDAEIALAAGMQGKFLEAHRDLIDREEPITDREIDELAQRLGLDVDRFRIDMKDYQMGLFLISTLDAVEILHIRSIPTFIVGDVMYTMDEDSATVETFDRLLEKAYGK